MMKNVLWIRKQAVALGLSLAGALAGAGCDVQGLIGPRGNQMASFGGSPTSTTTASLAGTWRHALFFVDDFGFTNSTETTWQFSGDGTALRTIVTRNITLGTSDATITVARWRVSGTRVIIDFVSPTTGTIELAFSVQGNQLILAGQTFTRVGG
jgi:hypothetical protein